MKEPKESANQHIQYKKGSHYFQDQSRQILNTSDHKHIATPSKSPLAFGEIRSKQINIIGKKKKSI